MDESAVEKQPPGLIVKGYLTLDEIVAPIFAEASKLCWWVSVQAGPFDSLWLYADKNEELTDRLHIQIDEFDDYGTSAWKRGFIPKLSPHVIIDEWTYFYGSAVDSAEFAKRAVESDKLSYYSNSKGPHADFYKYLVDNQDLFLMHVDGWWEIYDGDADRRCRFQEHFSDAKLRSWKCFGQSP